MINDITFCGQDSAAEVGTTSWPTTSWTHIPWLDEPIKGKKGKKRKRKSKKARKKLSKRIREQVLEQQLAAVNFRCGYLAAENDMLKRMITLSVGVQRNRLNADLLENGLTMLPRGKQ